MIKYVIFDMDGLMIDSEPLHFQAFNEVFRGFNKQLSEKDHKKYIGMPDIDEAKDLVSRYHLLVTPEEIVKRKQAEYRKLIAQAVTTQPGLMELLQKLHELRYKKGIASSSSLEEIEYVINSLEISKYIDVYCSAEQVKHGKPAPDVYLLAAAKLGIKPSDCLVLEDAPNGVKAARAAGMKVFAIPSASTMGGDFSGATKKLASLTEVSTFLQNQ